MRAVCAGKLERCSSGRTRGGSVEEVQGAPRTTLIKERIDLPEQVHRGDFVLRLTEGVTNPEATLENYVVTPQLVSCFRVALGVFTQVAALVLMAVMLGAIQKKLFVWHTGFWGDKTHGWHYDLMFFVANLVILTTGGGRLVLV